MQTKRSTAIEPTSFHSRWRELARVLNCHLRRPVPPTVPPNVGKSAPPDLIGTRVQVKVNEMTPLERVTLMDTLKGTRSQGAGQE